MIRRREFIAGIGGAAAWPLAAQQGGPVRRLGILMGWDESDPEARSWLSGFTRELSALGWTEGRNLAVDVRWGAGSVERLRTFSKELVNQRPDVILVNSTSATAALQRETRTIPIVFAVVSDPVGDGFVANLARPGGNLTGFIHTEAALAVSGLNYLLRSRRASAALQQCSIPIRLPAVARIICLPSRRRPNR
jgi:putative ABC transport system substrate-binding protein